MMLSKTLKIPSFTFSLKNALSGILLVFAANSTIAQITFEDVSQDAGFSGTGSETWGAAWGDINGDYYPDVFSTNHRTRSTLFRNNLDGTFTDVSNEVDLSETPGWTGGRSDVDTHGAIWGDIDNDGDDDLYITISSDDDILLINDGGLLTDRSAEWEVDRFGHDGGRMSLFLDYTGDGLLDVMAAALGNPRFYPRQNNGTFGYSRTWYTSVDCNDDASFAHIANIDAGIGLELICAPRNGVYPENIYGFASGVVSDVTSDFPQTNRVNDAITADFNGDLRPDIFEVIASSRPSGAVQVDSYRIETQLITASGNVKSTYFRTAGILTVMADLRAGDPDNGDPKYIDIGAGGYSPSDLEFSLDPNDSANWGIKTNSLGINIGYDTNEGVWQIRQNGEEYRYAFVAVDSDQPITDVVFEGATNADKPSAPKLLINNPSGFSDETTARGLNDKILCVSAVAGDLDNDMDQDIFLACTGGPENIANILYENQGDGTFTALANAGGAAGLIGAAYGDGAGTSESVIIADYDIDGFLDIFVTNGNNMRPVEYGGPKQLFHNLGNSNNWLEIDLEGTTSNRDGIGSKILITAGGITQYREQNGKYHRWSQNHKRIHVGLASNTLADISVEWPNGDIDEYTDVDANGMYKITQGDSIQLIISANGIVDDDGDLVDNTEEATDGTNPADPLDYKDTDSNGVPDAVEVIDGTNPNLYTDMLDSDGGGIPDYIETVLSPNSGQATFNPADPADDATLDTDSDGLADVLETLLGTNANNSDSDGGGINDGDELINGTDPLNGADDNSGNLDTDGDGLTDAQEALLGTDPNKDDSDDDWLKDGLEVNTYGTDPLHKNTDRDGINDF
ncbi:MAG: CRTAC1 family protein, partial [Gammaproteobacteria bacterium]|nr:CRTAC1 family protein [Gammaproteobacteria bacterium]